MKLRLGGSTWDEVTRYAERRTSSQPNKKPSTSPMMNVLIASSLYSTPPSDIASRTSAKTKNNPQKNPRPRLSRFKIPMSVSFHQSVCRKIVAVVGRPARWGNRRKVNYAIRPISAKDVG